jgi:hypothetical protein
MSSADHTPPYYLADINEHNADAMRDLFRKVFNNEISEAVWRWKYLPTNAHSIGVWLGDELVAHYGGIGAEIVMDGKPAKAIQIVDVMVLPAARHGVRSQSPFYLAGSDFLDRFIGYQQPYLLGYGFPSNRHLHLAEHLKLYASVGSITELSITKAASRWYDCFWTWQALTQANIQQHAAALEQVWRAMQYSLPNAILVCKNAQRLRYRYLQHPEQQYQLYLLRHRVTNSLQAVVVLKQEAARVLLMDVVCEHQRLATVLRRCAVLAKNQFGLPLAAWLSTAYAQALARDGIQLTELPIATPANIRTLGPSPAELQDRWWLMAGDTDFL